MHAGQRQETIGYHMSTTALMRKERFWSKWKQKEDEEHKALQLLNQTVFQRANLITDQHALDLFYYLHIRQYRPKSGPLNYAVQWGKKGLVKLILDSGKILQLRMCVACNCYFNHMQQNALTGYLQEMLPHYSNPLCYVESYDITMLLLKHGIDPNEIDGSCTFSTPLHCMAIQHRIKAVQAVVEFGLVTPDIPNSKGHTALFYVSTPAIVPLLVSAGFSVDFADKEGLTPLHRYVRYGDFELVKAILDAGCDYNVQDNKGRTPLHIACLTHGHSTLKEIRQIIETLVDDYGARTTILDKDGKTPSDLLPHFPMWDGIKNYLIDQMDGQLNHCFKKAKVSDEDGFNDFV